MEKREFFSVYRNILAVAPEELANILKRNVDYWAPEIAWHSLSTYVNKYVARCSTDPQSIAIYSELCDLSFADMKSKFEKDGL
jgi:hypothetical protein